MRNPVELAYNQLLEDYEDAIRIHEQARSKLDAIKYRLAEFRRQHLADTGERQCGSTEGKP